MVNAKLILIFILTYLTEKSLSFTISFRVIPRIFFLIVIFFFVVNLQGNVYAQETFGPICDTTIPGVTCAPTAPPQATSPPLPTTHPIGAPPPVSGNAETTLLFLALSGIDRKS